MRVSMIYEDEREEIVTYVSACGLQRKSNEAAKTPRLIMSTRIHMIKQYKRGLSKLHVQPRGRQPIHSV